MRAALAAILLLSAPGLSSYAAAAQVVSARGYAGQASIGPSGAALRAGLSVPVPFSFSSLSAAPLLSPLAAAPGLTPVVAPILAPSLAVSQQALVAPSVLAVPALISAPEKGPAAPQQALESLSAALQAEAPKSDAVSDRRLGRLFDGMGKRSGLDTVAPAATGRSVSLTASGLSQAVPQDARKEGKIVAKPAPAKSKTLRRVAVALFVAALLLAMPAIALAAGPAAAVGASASFLAASQPMASAIAALVGAVYGVIRAHRKGEPAPSAGQILASVLRYGILGGAGIYVLFDVTQIFFVGFSAIKPLSSAVAAAVLGQSAFQGKFTDPATTPSDRLIGAFPAIAAALGLSVGLILSAPIALELIALSALSVTAVASAAYAALYQPGKSAAAGPGRMARGYVLQTLMTGVALAVAGPYLTAAFMALAAWGFWDVLSTVLKEARSRLPEKFRKK